MDVPSAMGTAADSAEAIAVEAVMTLAIYMIVTFSTAGAIVGTA